MQIRERYATSGIQTGRWVLPSPLSELEEVKEVLPRLAYTYNTPIPLMEELDVNVSIISYIKRDHLAKLLSSLKERELRRLVAFSHSIETRGEET